MSSIIVKTLIFLIILKLSVCALTDKSFILNRKIRQSTNTLNLEANKADKTILDEFDKSDRLKINKQDLNSVLIPLALNNGIEDSTKTIVFWTPENYPNPFVDFKNCSIKEKGYICDPDEVLEEEDISKLRQSIEGLNENLDNHCTHVKNGKQGIDFGIAIMNQFQEIENKTQRDTAKEYAERIRNNWKLGGECDNGLLILQSSKDSILTFSMGKTTQKLIKNVTINALNLNTLESTDNAFSSSKQIADNQPLGQLKDAIFKLSTGLSFVNRDKALGKLNAIANKNPKVNNALKNIEATLEKNIEEKEMKEQQLNESNNNYKLYNGVNGELLLIYFLMFVLMVTIACFIVGILYKRRSIQNSNASL